MKLFYETWREFLNYGVRLMEGTETGFQWVGRKWLLEASGVFEECCTDEADPAVRAEAYLRRALCAHYQGKMREMEKWLKLGELCVGTTLLPPETRAQCNLLQGNLLAHGYKYYEAILALLTAANDSSQNLKLRGEAEMSIGRIYWEHGAALDHEAKLLGPASLAIKHFEEAISLFLAIPRPEVTVTVLHALTEISGRVGVALQARDGYGSARAAEHFRRAEHLFATRVKEPHERATYWFRRARMALLFFRPQGFWFLFRCLPPGISSWWQKHRNRKR